MGKIEAQASHQTPPPPRHRPNGTPNDNMNALRVNSALKFPSVGKKTATKTAAPPKKTVAEPVAPAQSFVIRIPGQFFQSKKDIVWPVTLGFTKSNELFVGRMAMLGFASSLIGEILTGNGPLAQFDV